MWILIRKLFIEWKKERENKAEFQMFLKKGAVCTWITPEENNEEISYIWEKKICNKSCNLALRKWNSSSCWEPTQGLCITESSRWGCWRSHSSWDRSPEEMNFTLTEQMTPGTLLFVKFNNFSDYGYQSPIFAEEGYWSVTAVISPAE